MSPDSASDSAWAPQPLCESAALLDGGRAWVWTVQDRGQAVGAFALRFDGQVRAYLNRCVHWPTELDWQEGQFFDGDGRWIVCAVHGASYDPVDGRCVGGPCGRGQLTVLDVREHGGQVTWYPDDRVQPQASRVDSGVPPDRCPPADPSL